MNRLVQFVRSVMPADLFQLIFLSGVVCLTVAPHLRWWPPQRDLTDLSQKSSQHARFEWAMFMSGAIWPIILSGMAFFAANYPILGCALAERRRSLLEAHSNSCLVSCSPVSFDCFPVYFYRDLQPPPSWVLLLSIVCLVGSADRRTF